MYSKQANKGFVCEALVGVNKGFLNIIFIYFLTSKNNSNYKYKIKNTNLYISGLPKYFTRDDVQKYFSKFGKIISIRQLTCKDTGLSRGVSFVRYDTRFEADNAVRHGNRSIICPGFDPITVKVIF